MMKLQKKIQKKQEKRTDQLMGKVREADIVSESSGEEIDGMG